MEQIGLEKSLLSYLNIYGNTRETDLVEFGINFSGKSKEDLVNIIDDMVTNGSIQRVVHYLLESSQIYIARVYWAYGNQVDIDALELKNKDHFAEEVKEIKNKAKTIANKKNKQHLISSNSNSPQIGFFGCNP